MTQNNGALPTIDFTTLKPEAEQYWRWHQIHTIPPLPSAVAREGAGSELRSKFMHVGTVMPIYLAIGRYLNSLPTQRGRKLIELGSGSGRVLAYLKEQLPDLDIYGVDYSAACIAYATAHYASYGVKFKIMKPAKTPYKEQSFDYVISSHVIEHIKKQDGKAFLQEVRRLLTRGGLAFIGTPNRKRCQDIYMENPTDDPKFRLVPPHEHEYEQDELLALASSVFGKDKVTVNKISNQKFATVFADSIASFRPTGATSQQLKQKAYQFSTKILPRPIFDQIAQIGTKRIMRKQGVDYDDVLYANIIANADSKVTADNFLLVCKR